MWSRSLRNADFRDSVIGFMVCCVLQGLPSLCALCNNEITNYRNGTVIHMVNVSCYIPSTTFCCSGYTACWYNIQHKTGDKIYDMNTFLKTLPKNTQHGNYYITCTTNMVQAKYYYIIHLQLKIPLYEHWSTYILNKSYLPFKIPRKPEEWILRIRVSVETPAGTCLASHSKGDILKQKDNHTPYWRKYAI